MSQITTIIDHEYKDWHTCGFCKAPIDDDFQITRNQEGEEIGYICECGHEEVWG